MTAQEKLNSHKAMLQNCLHQVNEYISYHSARMEQATGEDKAFHNGELDALTSSRYHYQQMLELFS